MFDQFGWDLHYLLPERFLCAAFYAEFWFLTSFLHRTTKRRRRNNVLLMSPLSERSVARHVTVLGRWELVPGRPLTFLKVMSILFRLKSLNRVAELRWSMYVCMYVCMYIDGRPSLSPRGALNLLLDTRVIYTSTMSPASPGRRGLESDMRV